MSLHGSLSILMMMVAIPLALNGSGASVTHLKDWSRGWDDRSRTLHLQNEQEVRLQTPIHLSEQKLGLMLKVKGGAGNILLGLEREKQVVMTWKAYFDSETMVSEFLGGDETLTTDAEQRPEGWMNLKVEGFEDHLLLSLDGKRIGKLSGLNLDGPVYLRITSEGDFDSAQIDEVHYRPVLKGGASFFPLAPKPKPLPQDWTSKSGHWSVLPFPGEEGGFYTLSSSNEGLLKSSMVLLDSMELKLRCRFEGGGSIGVSLMEEDGQTYRLWLRDHSFGLLLERKGEDGMEVLLREEPQFYPGLWYELELHYSHGKLVVMVEGLKYELPISIPSGSALSLISKDTVGSFFQILSSGGWVSMAETGMMTPLRVSDLGVKPGGNWLETPTLRFGSDQEGLFKVESREEALWNGMGGIWKPKDSRHVYAQVESDASPRLDFLMSGEAWWALTSRLKEVGDVQEAKLPSELQKLLPETFMSSRLIENVQKINQNLAWSMRVFGEDRNNFLLISAGGERVGTLPFSNDKRVKWSLGSIGKADLEEFKLVSGGAVERDSLLADGPGFSIFGGGFGTSSLDGGGALTLGEPLLKNSEIELDVFSPTNWGRWAFELVDSKGKAVTETYVDLREPPFSLFHLKGDEDGGVVDEPEGDSWNISISRDNTSLKFSQSGEAFGPILTTTDEPLFLRFSGLEGELDAKKIKYGWKFGARSNFQKGNWSKHTMRDWKGEKGVERAEKYEASPVGPIGTITKKEGLSQFHEVYLKKRPRFKKKVGSRNKVSWTSEKNRCQVLFVQLDEGVEVELSLNGTSKGKVMVEDRGFSFWARYLPEGTSYWLGGVKLFEGKPLDADGWEWALSSDGEDEKGLWAEVMWRNL